MVSFRTAAAFWDASPGHVQHSSQHSFAIAAKSFLSIRLVSSIDTTAAWKKKLCYILSNKSDFHMTDSLSMAVHAFASHMLMLLSVDETLLPRKYPIRINRFSIKFASQ